MKRISSTIFVFLLLFVLVIIFWQNRYVLSDWITLRNFTPTEEIKTIAENSGFNEKGKTLFYVNKPELLSKETFSQKCQNNKEKTIVLGCYNGSRIYIYDVPDDRLQGVEEVTSSHEMLHAAYDRLNIVEKRRIDELLNEEYKRIDNPRIQNIIAKYREIDPSIVTNELHSILGTEVEFLSAELEKYYSRYFKNRIEVVNLSKKYEETLVKNNKEIEKIDAELIIRRNEIQELAKEIDLRYERINSDKASLEMMRSSGNISSYNSIVNKYNSDVNKYNENVSRYKLLIDEYNQLINKRNNLSTESQKLNESLDSRVKAL